MDVRTVLPRTAVRRKAAAERTEKEWARIRIVILDALEPFPGAREAVVDALVQHCETEQQEAEQQENNDG